MIDIANILIKSGLWQENGHIYMRRLCEGASVLETLAPDFEGGFKQGKVAPGR